MVKSAAFGPVIAGLREKINAALPMFVRVTVRVALLPTAIAPNARVVGARLTTGAITDPVPVNGMVCVVGEALSAKLSVAVLAPVVEGLNVKVTVHVWVGATEAAVEQVDDVMAKSAAFTPVMVGLLVNISGEAPMFCRTAFIGRLVAFCGSEPKDTVDVTRRTIGGPVIPFPLSWTICVPALSTKESEAFSARPEEGVNVTITAQLAPEATMEAVEQVDETMAKSAAFVPVMAGLLLKITIKVLSVLRFMKVTVMTELVVPLATEPNVTELGTTLTTRFPGE
jgi:hypothetical protein